MRQSGDDAKDFGGDPKNGAAALLIGPGSAFAHTGSWDSIAVDDTRGSRGGDAGYGVGTGNMGADVHKYDEEGEMREKEPAGAVVCLNAA